MQFLVTGRTIRTGDIPSSDEIAWLKEGVNQFKQDSRTKQFYGFAGEWAACIICDCNTPAELDEYLSLNPLDANTEWEIHPLTTVDEVISVLDKVAKHIGSLEEAA